MLQFIVQSILQLGVYCIATFAFYGYVRPHSKGWITRRIRDWGDKLSKQPKGTRCLVLTLFLMGNAVLYLMDRRASWKTLHDDPFKRQAARIAENMESVLISGVRPFQIQTTFANALNRLVPNLEWTPELREQFLRGDLQNSNQVRMLITELKKAAK